MSHEFFQTVMVKGYPDTIAIPGLVHDNDNTIKILVQNDLYSLHSKMSVSIAKTSLNESIYVVLTCHLSTPILIGQ